MSRKSGLPPGPKAPRRYQQWRLKTDPVGFVESNAERYGGVFTIRLAPGDTCVVATLPGDIEAVLRDRDRFSRGEASGHSNAAAGEGSRDRIEGTEDVAEAEFERLPSGERIALLPAMQRIVNPRALPEREAMAVALAWAGERLSRYLQVQQVLAAELDAGGDAYLEAVLQETLRTRPPALERIHIAVADTELGGHPIPAGTRVLPMPCVVNRRPDIWGDALCFRPQRFLEGGPLPHSFAPMPRWSGAASAGADARIVLKAMLGRFHLEQARALEERMRLSGTTLVPAKGGLVVLRPRDPRPRAGTPQGEFWPGLVFSR